MDRAYLNAFDAGAADSLAHVEARITNHKKGLRSVVQPTGSSDVAVDLRVTEDLRGFPKAPDEDARLVVVQPFAVVRCSVSEDRPTRSSNKVPHDWWRAFWKEFEERTDVFHDLERKLLSTELSSSVGPALTIQNDTAWKTADGPRCLFLPRTTNPKLLCRLRQARRADHEFQFRTTLPSGHDWELWRHPERIELIVGEDWRALWDAPAPTLQGDEVCLRLTLHARLSYRVPDGEGAACWRFTPKDDELDELLKSDETRCLEPACAYCQP